VYHSLLRIHKLVPKVRVPRLLALGRPMTADADDRRLRVIGELPGMAGWRHILTT
jgi:hypothetical protein